MEKLAIIGSGDLGQQIAHIALSDNHYQLAGYFDDFEIKGETKNGIPILGGISEVQKAFENQLFDVLLIAIGYHHFETREKLFLQFKNNIPFGKIIHSSSLIDSTVIIGLGSVIYSGCILDMNVKIGENVLIYNGCNFAHDVELKNHSIISPGVQIAGFSSIGQSVNLGIGTIISDHISIVENTKTGAGTVVVKSIEKPGVYIGVPAKKIQK
jgi:sugar O-acyltransferase (sialic acid O-acetyltransferase NeuD family)